MTSRAPVLIGSGSKEGYEFYTSVFKDSKVLGRTDLPDPELSVVRLELAGLPVAALNARSRAPYSEAFSFLVETADQILGIGGSSGTGRGIATFALKSGADVVIVCRSREKCRPQNECSLRMAASAAALLP